MKEALDTDLTILLAREGSRKAFRQIYDRYCRSVYRLARRYTGNQQDAEDIMQETFIKAFKNISKLKKCGQTSFTAWLNRITVHTTIEHLRRIKRQGIHITNPLEQHFTETPDEGLSPEEHTQKHHMLIRLNQALATLSHRQRIIFDLRHSKHLAISEIAEYLDCSQSTVKTQLGRGLNKLKLKLEPLWEIK